MSALRKILSSEAGIGALLSLAVFLVYLSTLSSGVQYEDAGELAAVAGTLGVAHPPGYPLFTLLGYAWAQLPVFPPGSRVIWRLNLLAALECALAVGVFYRAFLLLLADKSLFPRKRAAPASQAKKAPAPPRTPGASDRFTAAAAVLVLAFARTFWSEAVSVEVYSLHLLLLSVVLFAFLRAQDSLLSRPGSVATRWWLFFAFALGLGFSNHMMTVLLAPAFVYLHFALHGAGRRAWTRIAVAVPPFLLGLTPYLYLPLRAAQDPLMNWGDPSGLRSFWGHVSTEQYRGRMFSSLDVLAKKLPEFFAAYPREFGYLPLVLAVLGLWTLARGNRRMLVFSLLLFFGCLVYSLNYDFNDPNFYLHAYVATAVWVLYGARRLLEPVRRRTLAAVACALCALCPLALNYSAVDASEDYAVEDYAENMFQSLDPGAVLISGQEANFTAAAGYLQAVEHKRPDVSVLSYPLLILPWYYDVLDRQIPAITGDPRTGIPEYRRRYTGYEAEAPAARDAIVRDIVRGQYDIRPVYVTSDLVPVVQQMEGFRGMPSGLAIRVTREVSPPALQSPIRFRPFVRQNDAIEKIRTFYAGAYLNQGIYRAMAGDLPGASLLFRSSLEVKPDFFPASQWLARVEGTVP
jgi:hypothetical protein